MSQNVFITGGAGFIGVNAALRYSQKEYHVTVFDNLSRRGSEKNLDWLHAQNPSVNFVKGDVRDAALLADLFAHNRYDLVLHCAGQVAVTTSVLDPLLDHEVNIRGTLNVLEALRHGQNPQAPFIFTSTNKVYGGLEHLYVQEGEMRYTLAEKPNGIDEWTHLDFHSPYGCSKGSADQYVRDFARIYGLNTVVFRQSCIYGPRQMGMEDQGWVVWIISRAVLGEPARVYGNGKQVRDLLHVEDLQNAYDRVVDSVEKTRGQIYNIGGGPRCAMSVIELLRWLQRRYPAFVWEYHPWRSGDQKVYVSDISKAREHFGWEPGIAVDDGLLRMVAWVEENKELFRSAPAPIAPQGLRV